MIFFDFVTNHNFWTGILGGWVTSAAVFTLKFGAQVLKWNVPNLEYLSINCSLKNREEFPDVDQKYIEHDGFKFRKLMAFEIRNQTDQAICISNLSFTPKIRKYPFIWEDTAIKFHKASAELPCNKLQPSYEIKFGPGDDIPSRFDRDTLIRANGVKLVWLALDDDVNEIPPAGQRGTIAFNFYTKSGFGKRQFTI